MQSYDVEVWMPSYTYVEGDKTLIQEAEKLVPAIQDKQRLPRPTLDLKSSPHHEWLRRKFRDAIDPAVTQAENRGVEQPDGLVEFRVRPFA